MKRPGMLGVLLVLAVPTVAAADGGTVRASSRRGPLQVTVFTSPVPPRAGPIDVSVFAQDATSGTPQSGVEVWVKAAPRVRPDSGVWQPATAGAATNKLFLAATVPMPEPGWWAVDVRVEGRGDPADVTFEMEVAEPLPAWWSLATWVVWPAAAVALYGCHRVLVRRKDRR